MRPPVVIHDGETGELWVFAGAAAAEEWVDADDAELGSFDAWDADGTPLRFERAARPAGPRSRRDLLLGGARRVLRPLELSPIDGASARPEELRALLADALAGAGMGVDELAGRELDELLAAARERLAP